MKFIHFVFFFLFIPQSYAQSLSELVGSISLYSDIVVNTERSETRTQFQTYLKTAVEKFLQTPNSFNYQITEPVWISIKETEDKTLRLITWELNEGDNHYKYFGYVQLADGSYLELYDQSDDLEDIEYSALDNEFWYGNLYYNLISKYDPSGKTYYIAFGINRKDKYTTTKTAEVFSIDDGKLKIGMPVFRDDSGVKERLHLTFSSDANVTLNHNSELGVIIFDHLISRMGNIPGQGPTQLPDGSYSGYQYSEGEWVYVDKMYNQVSATPPGDGSRKKNDKDLFGRVKN